MKLRASHIVSIIGLIVFAFILFVAMREETRQAAPDGTGAGQSGLAQPEIVLSSESVDMGVITNQDKTTISVTLSNKGMAPLIIKNIQGSCSCIAAEMDVKKIEPGASAPLRITMDPFEIAGFASIKEVIINTNDPARHTISMSVTAKIEPEFSLEPEQLDLGEVEKGSIAEGVIRMRQTSDVPLELMSIDLGTPAREGFNVTFALVPPERRVDPTKAEYLITARIEPEAKVGTHVAQVRLMTNCKRLEKGFDTAVKFAVTTFYEVSPSGMLVLDRVGSGNEKAGVFIIKSQKPMEAVSASTDVEGVTVSLTQDDPLTIRAALGFDASVPPGTVRGKVHFDLKQGEKVVSDILPFSGFVGLPGTAPAPTAAPESVPAPAQ